MVTSEFSPSGRSGGAGIYVHHLSEELCRRGHDVDLITSVESGSESVAPFKVYDVKLTRVRIMGMLRWSIESYLCAMRLMQSKNYDVVNVHSPLCFFYPWLNNPKTPMVVTMHSGWDLSNPAYTPLGKVFSFSRDFVSWKRAAKIVVLNRSVEQGLVRWGIPKGKIECVTNAIKWNEFSQRRKNAGILRERLGIPRGAIVVLNVGRLGRGKGIEYLLEAFIQAQRSTAAPMWLVIAGDETGSAHPISRASYQRTYRDLKNVIFTGFLSRGPPEDDLISAYQDSDLFVFPSEASEGMPTVLLEAMAAGLPIVTTRVSGAKDVVRREFGTLVNPGNPEELACALLNMIADRATLKEMGRRAASWSKQFDWSIVASRIAEVYESCLRR